MRDLGGGVASAAEWLADEDVVDGEAVIVAAEAQAAGGVGLGVAVDEEGWDAFRARAAARLMAVVVFADAAFLVDDGDDFGWEWPRLGRGLGRG